MSAYPAITLWQPWASLVMAGAKPYEFRSWPAPVRLQGKRVAIHAGARPIKRAEMQELLLKLLGSDWALTGLQRDVARPIVETALTSPQSLPRSAITCLATLGTPLHGAALAEKLGLGSINDSNRVEHSNWGWPLTDIEPLTPYAPASGSQGWWTWNAGAAA
jgi:hypothetical protein